MALVLADRVLETCTSPGTGAVTLLGAVTGYQAFSAAVGNGNTCYYAVADQNGANWEVGVGTYASAGNTLTRTTVLASSNGGSLTNFASGSQNVFLTYPAEKAVSTDTLAYPPAIGSTTPNSGAFTTLSASSTVSGTGFSTYLASPPAIGGTAPNTGSFTTLTATGAITHNTTTNNQSYTTTGAGTITLTSGTAGTINNFNIGATTAGTGAFTTISASSTVSGTGFSTYLASPPAIGATTAGTGAFTTLSASSTVSGTGFSTYLASPPAIGSTAANTGAFTTLGATGAITFNTTTNNQSYTTTGAGTITLTSGTTGTINNFNIGGTTAGTGAFTTLSASSTVSGAGFTNYFASPPAIGSTAANTGAFTTLSASSNVTFSGTGYTQLQSGTTAQRPGSPTVGMIRYNSDNKQFEGYSGVTPSWLPVGGSVISNDTATATQVYPLFSNATSGTATTVYTSNANLLYKPSTGELQSQAMISNNGLTVNNKTVATSYTIASGYSASSAGPITVNSGVTVTISSGSRWVIL